MVVASIAPKSPQQMPLSQSDDMVRGLSADGSDDSFAIRILPRASCRRPHGLDAEDAEFLTEEIGKDGVPVVNQVLRNRLVSREGFDQLPCRPICGGMSSHFDVQDLPPVVMEDNKDIEELERECRNDKEVAGSGHGHVVAQEGFSDGGPPSGLSVRKGTTFWRREIRAGPAG